MVVVGGDLFLRPGSDITGSAIAIGGGVYRSFLGTVGGTSRAFATTATSSPRVRRTLRARRIRDASADRAEHLPARRSAGLHAAGVRSRERPRRCPSAPRDARQSRRRDRAVGRRTAAGWACSIPASRSRVLPERPAPHRSGRRRGAPARTTAGSTRTCQLRRDARLRQRHAKLLSRRRRNGASHRTRRDGTTFEVEPFVGGRYEKVQPDHGRRATSCSVAGRDDRSSTWRGPIRSSSAARSARRSPVRGSRTRAGQVRARLEAEGERSFETPDRHVVVHAAHARRRDRASRPSGCSACASMRTACATAGDTTPRARYAYLGRSGTLPLLELLEQGGDQLAVRRQPLRDPDRARSCCRCVGSPTVYAPACAWAPPACGRCRSWSSSSASGVGSQMLRADSMADVRRASAARSSAPASRCHRSDGSSELPRELDAVALSRDARRILTGVKVASGARLCARSASPRPSAPHVKTLAVIPARLGATRLPRKPLRLLGGVPLVVRVLERVVALRRRRPLHRRHRQRRDRRRASSRPVARPSSPTARTRAGPTASPRSRARADCRGFDAILNVQGDEPFVAAAAVRGALAQVADARLRARHRRRARRAATCCAARRGQGRRCRRRRARCIFRARRFRSCATTPTPPMRDARVLQHVGVYAYTPDALARWVALPVASARADRAAGAAAPPRARHAHGRRRSPTDAARGGIDTEEDLALANREWATFTTTES